MNVGALIATLGVDTTGFMVGMKQAEMAMKTTGASMKRVGSSLLYITGGLALIGGASFKMAKDFEASMAKVQGLVGVSKKQVDAWAASILQLAPSLGKSPQELADALFFITSAGIKGAEAMEVLEMSAKAASLGLGETKVVADLVTSAMNAYGKENLSAAEATDILVATVREGKAEADALAGAMGQVLPIASAMGVTFGEVGAAVAGMTRTGTEASTAAMQLKNILASLLSPAQQAEEAFGTMSAESTDLSNALSYMGTSAAEVRQTIKEKGLLVALQDLQKMTGGNSEEIAKLFPNIRALTGFLDLMGSNVADNVEIFGKLADATGDMDKAFAVTQETVQFKLDKALATLTTSLTTLGTTVTQVVIPMLQSMAAGISSLTAWFNTLSDAQKEWTVKIAGAIAILGPFLIILGSLISAIGTITTAFAFLAGPVGLVVLALAALGTAVYLIVQNVKAAQEASKTYQDKLKQLGGTVEELNTKMDSEVIALGQVFAALKKTTPGTELRKILIDKVNTQYGEYLPNLLTEKSTLEDIATAEKTATAAMRQRLALKFATEKTNAILEAQMKREEALLSALALATPNAPLSAYMTAFEEFVKGAGQAGAEMQNLMAVTHRSYSDLYLMFSSLANKRNADNKAIQDAMAVYAAFGGVIDDVGKKAAEIKFGPPAPEGSTIGANGQTVVPPAGGGSTGKPTPFPSVEELQFELSLIGKTDAAQRALTIAKEKGIKVGSEEYKQILALTTQIQVYQEKMDAAAAADSKAATAKEQLNSQMSDLEFELSLLGKSEAVQRAMTIARANDVVVGSDQYEKILQLTTALVTNTEAARAAIKADEEASAAKERLNENYEMIKESVMSEEEAIKQSYEDKIAIVRKYYEENGGAIQEMADLISALTKQMNADLGSVTAKSKNMFQDMRGHSQEWASFIMSISTEVGAVLGNMVMGQKKGWLSLVDVVISSILKMITAMLAMAIAGMISDGATKGLPGLILAAIGVAAIGAMWAGLVSPKLQGLATGGDVTKSGSFWVGEEGPELVNLRAGSAVVPNHAFNQKMAKESDGYMVPELVTSIHGDQIDFILTNWQRRKSRMS